MRIAVSEQSLITPINHTVLLRQRGKVTWASLEFFSKVVVRVAIKSDCSDPNVEDVDTAGLVGNINAVFDSRSSISRIICACIARCCCDSKTWSALVGMR